MKKFDTTCECVYGCGMIIGMIFSIALSLAFIGCAVYIVIRVLQYTGVI